MLPWMDVGNLERTEVAATAPQAPDSATMSPCCCRTVNYSGSQANVCPTRLFCLCKQHDAEGVRQRLAEEAGSAELAVMGSGGRAVLHMASAGQCPRNDVEIVALLLAHPDTNADQRDTMGRTPLFCATMWGFDEAIEMLLDNGADSSLAAYFSPLQCVCTPLQVARCYGRAGSVALLQASIAVPTAEAAAVPTAVAASKEVVVTCTAPLAVQYP